MTQYKDTIGRVAAKPSKWIYNQLLRVTDDEQKAVVGCDIIVSESVGVREAGGIERTTPIVLWLIYVLFVVVALSVATAAELLLGSASPLVPVVMSAMTLSALVFIALSVPTFYWFNIRNVVTESGEVI